MRGYRAAVAARALVMVQSGLAAAACCSTSASTNRGWKTGASHCSARAIAVAGAARAAATGSGGGGGGGGEASKRGRSSRARSPVPQDAHTTGQLPAAAVLGRQHSHERSFAASAVAGTAMAQPAPAAAKVELEGWEQSSMQRSLQETRDAQSYLEQPAVHRLAAEAQALFVKPAVLKDTCALELAVAVAGAATTRDPQHLLWAAQAAEVQPAPKRKRGRPRKQPASPSLTPQEQRGMEGVVAAAVLLRDPEAAAAAAAVLAAQPQFGLPLPHSLQALSLPQQEQQQQQQQQQQQERKPEEQAPLSNPSMLAWSQVAPLPVAEAQALPPLPVPNLGYACYNHTLRREERISTTRTCRRSTVAEKGLPHISALVLANCQDLLRVLEWNAQAGIRLYRLPSGLLPWVVGEGSEGYALEQLPDYEAIAAALARAGELARATGQRLTSHPPHFVKLASRDEDLLRRSLRLLEMQSQVFDLMGFEPSPHNKLNIHVGGVYGNKGAALQRFAAGYRRLSPGAAARLTVENDDRPNLFSVADLLPLSADTGIPITFDAHHHRFCGGRLGREEALAAALATWPQGVRPVVHWSEPPECPRRARAHPRAHSSFVFGPISLHGREAEVDIMIESRGAEQALLLYRDRLLPLERAGLLPHDDAKWEAPLGQEEAASMDKE